MNTFSIITLPPERWQEYKSLRLQSLKNDPIAFARTYQEDAALTDAQWQNRLQDKPDRESYMLFAQIEGKLVGMSGAIFYQGSCVEHRATIVSVYVAPEYRGQGIAKRIMQSLMDYLQKTPKIVHVQLTVNTTNLAAIKLYQELGFNKIGILEKFGKVNNEFIDAYMMIKILDK